MLLLQVLDLFLLFMGLHSVKVLHTELSNAPTLLEYFLHNQILVEELLDLCQLPCHHVLDPIKKFFFLCLSPSFLIRFFLSPR